MQCAFFIQIILIYVWNIIQYTACLYLEYNIAVYFDANRTFLYCNF